MSCVSQQNGSIQIMVRLDLPKMGCVVTINFTQASKKAKIFFFYLCTNQRTSGVLHEIVHQLFLADSAECVWEI